MSRAIRFVTGVLLIALFCAPMLAQADTHIVTKSTTSQFVMGRDTIPASEMTSNIWMGKDHAIMKMDTASVLIDMAKSKMYMLDNNSKTYVEMPIGSMNEMMDAMGVDSTDEQSAAVMEMMKNMMGNMKFTVTPTEETKKIGDYDCKRYDVSMDMSMLKMNSQVWASKAIDVDMGTYFRLSNAMMAMFPGMEDAIAEWKKIEGFPVLTVGTTDMMGQELKTTSEMISAEQADAPAGTYAIPEGYTKKEMNFMGN